MVNLSKLDLETLLDWSIPNRVFTKQGFRLLSKSIPDKKFWNIWRDNKDKLKEAGIQVTKDKEGNWEVLWWRPDKNAQESVELSKQTSSKIDIPSPNGLEYLPFQLAGIEFATNRKSVLFGDEMGLGKTIEAIGVINNNENPGKILIVCPKRLKINWYKELKKWLVHDLKIKIVENSNDWFKTVDVMIINYDLLNKYSDKLRSEVWDYLIVDEAHYLKNYKAQRTQAIVGNYKKHIPPVEAKHKLFLTGTPILNRPIEGWTIFNYLDNKNFRSFKKYTNRYCDVKTVSIGYGKFAIDYTGASNLEELQEKLRSTFMIRRLKNDVLKELPPKRRQVIEIPTNGNKPIVDKEKSMTSEFEAKREELKLQAELAKALENKEDYNKVIQQLRETSTAMFNEISKQRHETALAKIPDVCAHLENMVEEGIDKIVVFAHHRDVVEAIHKQFKDNSVILYGGMSAKDSEKSITEFQNNDKIKLFIGNIQSAGVGITLTASNHVVFAELDWVPANMSQAEDRCHRIGQQNSVLVQHLVLEDSLDANIAKALVEKQNILDEVLDEKIDIDKSEPITTVDVVINESVVGKPIKKDIWSENTKKRLLEGLKIISSYCDGARALDKMGFNKFDTNIGKAFAQLDSLTNRQATIAYRLVTKYKRQLPNDFMDGYQIPKKGGK